jgi:hypothetical protein
MTQHATAAVQSTENFKTKFPQKQTAYFEPDIMIQCDLPIITVALSASLMRRPPPLPPAQFFFFFSAFMKTSTSSFSPPCSTLAVKRARFALALLGSGAFNGEPSFRLLLRRLNAFSLLMLDAAAVAAEVNNGAAMTTPATPPREAASRCRSNCG